MLDCVQCGLLASGLWRAAVYHRASGYSVHAISLVYNLRESPKRNPQSIENRELPVVTYEFQYFSLDTCAVGENGDEPKRRRFDRFLTILHHFPLRSFLATRYVLACIFVIGRDGHVSKFVVHVVGYKAERNFTVVFTIDPWEKCLAFIPLEIGQ